ncbi:MAG: hypothetical protein LT070_00710 [Solirubrobacteraceae bacterium]|nr:hypothetical protein [Solirubrobacteraceae bacterium]
MTTDRALADSWQAVPHLSSVAREVSVVHPGLGTVDAIRMTFSRGDLGDGTVERVGIEAAAVTYLQRLLDQIGLAAEPGACTITAPPELLGRLADDLRRHATRTAAELCDPEDRARWADRGRRRPSRESAACSTAG